MHRKSSLDEYEDRTWIDSLDEADVELLRPRFLAEVTSLLDTNSKPLHKRKPVKANRKSGKTYSFIIDTIFSESRIETRKGSKKMNLEIKGQNISDKFMSSKKI